MIQVKEYTAISRNVRKNACDNPERYCGWVCVHCFSKKFERMAREAMDLFLRVLKESSKSNFDSFSVRNSVLIISHITFRDRRAQIFFPTTFLEIAVSKTKKNKVTKIKGWETWQLMLSISFSVISFSHIIYLIKRGFEITGESLRMVINMEYTIVSNIWAFIVLLLTVPWTIVSEPSYYIFKRTFLLHH